VCANSSSAGDTAGPGICHDCLPGYVDSDRNPLTPCVHCPPGHESTARSVECLAPFCSSLCLVHLLLVVLAVLLCGCCWCAKYRFPAAYRGERQAQRRAGGGGASVARAAGGGAKAWARVRARAAWGAVVYLVRHCGRSYPYRPAQPFVRLGDDDDDDDDGGDDEQASIWTTSWIPPADGGGEPATPETLRARLREAQELQRVRAQVRSGCC
jgi:hypothetical protein